MWKSTHMKHKCIPCLEFHPISKLSNYVDASILGVENYQNSKPFCLISEGDIQPVHIAAPSTLTWHSHTTEYCCALEKYRK